MRKAGFNDIHFIDAMTDTLTNTDLWVRLAKLAPDVKGVTAIIPAIYVAKEMMRIASEVVPKAGRVLGGVHGTFMYRQVLSEAPWIDATVRGEGEEVLTALMRCVHEGR